MSLQAQVHVDVEALTSMNITGNHSSLGYQMWGSPHGNALIAYMNASELRAVADHFAALADEVASRDIEREAAAA